MDSTVRRAFATYDGILTICLGNSRRCKIWKPKQMSWSQLIKKLSQTKRTAEKHKEYLAMDKASQDAIKDVGGFVGGELQDGRRTSLTVMNRGLVTLDADFADTSLWSLVETGVAFGQYAICCYSTHKHTPEKPRLRLVIPLDRTVTPDEYQAISRKIAEDFGIDNFDDTTYQPHRLMYWPSTSIDGDYFFRWQDGPWLPADKVLEEYEDWRDQASWPVSSRVSRQVQHAITKQRDPTEKKGLIGTFCRAYTIDEAIAEFLPEVYEPCGDRYTFTAGSSSGGAVPYEGKWLYSFHATDPCSCQLVNAFDLIRIHKYGELDEGRVCADATKMPSYAAMMEFIRGDAKVKALLMRERMAEVRDEFEDLGDEGDLDEQDFDWAAKLETDKNGKFKATRSNIRTVLENDPHVKKTFGWDDFTSRIVIKKAPSWRDASAVGAFWEDSDDAELRYLMETLYGISNKQSIEDEVLSVSKKNAFHQIRDYLATLKWDGTPRIETLFVDYLGADDTQYVRTVTRKMLIAAVARVMKPGVKFDYMLVLQGPQGIGKSMILKELGGDWFSDSLDAMQGKEAYEQLRGAWLIEVGELAALRSSEVEATKKFITKQTDTYRVAYGRRTQDFPRQCIFIGTTNETQFLKDRTGNRRFWPVRVGKREVQKHPWDEDFKAIVGQIWAEAKTYYEQGESLWIGAEMEKEAVTMQKMHTSDIPMVGVLAEYLDKEVPANWYNLAIQDRRDFLKGTLEPDMTGAFKRNRICALEVWCELLERSLASFQRREQRDINEALRAVDGWRSYEGGKYLRFGNYGRQRAYVRISG
ncbi:MAG: virulence-associated E family protein [Selenomonadaceae bacterium]|nr:virulence-associated E family protein [Selenomonadaceae bacterium]